MIRAFCDESEQSDVFLVAGWVTDFDTWTRFTEDWQSVLDERPAIKYFKHHEAKGEPPTGEFSGWEKADIEAKISSLVDVICRHEMYGVNCGTRVSTINAALATRHVPRKTLRSVAKGTHHYQLCVFCAIALVLGIQLDLGIYDKMVDFVFDEFSGLLPECMVLHKKNRYRYSEEMQRICGLLTQGNDKQIGALQAADLLAGQITTSVRYNGKSELHLERMVTAHKVYRAKAYPDNFRNIPAMIQQLDKLWGLMQYSRKMERTIEKLLRKSDDKDEKKKNK